LRVPARSGQVGLRPRGEPTVLAVEAGLVIGSTCAAAASQFIGTAGGLLTSNGREIALLTALAVIGDTAEAVLAALEQALATPNAELAARAAIDRLESGILQELRRERGESSPRSAIGLQARRAPNALGSAEADA
jgi:F0F1-type ATP synthase epsilon subunit